ncbi:MAG: caspase family protein [Bryobacteraceae bacterium]
MRTVTLFATAAVLCVSAGRWAVAQTSKPPGKPAGTPGKTGTYTAKDLARADAVQDATSGQKYINIAFLVGIGDYDRDLTGLPPLKYPAHDIMDLAGVLKREGYTVALLQDSQATAGRIRTTFRDLTKQLDKGEGTFIFFFSGHGFQYGKENYLATYGTTNANLAGQGLPLSEVTTLLFETGAKRRIAFVDACRNDPDAKSAGPTRSFGDLQESEGMRILYSTAPGSVSFEDENLQHGVFTYFLMEGLKGEAANSLDGYITFDDLDAYVSRKMRSYGIETGRIQKPFQLGEHNGDFFIAKPPVSTTSIVQPTGPGAIVDHGAVVHGSKMPLQRLRTIDTGAVSSAAFSPDGRLLASPGSDNSVRLWSLESGKQVATLTGPNKPALGVQFSPDSRLVVAGGDKALWIWEAENNNAHKMEDRGLGTVLSASFSLDRKFLVSSGSDKAVRVWNAETGQVEANLKLSSQGVWAGLSPDQNTVGIVERDLSLQGTEKLGGAFKHAVARLWSWRSTGTAVMLPFSAGAQCLAFAPDGRRLVGGLQSGTLRSWDISDVGHPQPGLQFDGHTQVVEFLAFSADGKLLASAGADMTFRLWNPNNAAQFRSLDAPSGTERILGLSFATDGRLLAATLRAGEIQILQVPLP